MFLCLWFYLRKILYLAGFHTCIAVPLEFSPLGKIMMELKCLAHVMLWHCLWPNAGVVLRFKFWLSHCSGRSCGCWKHWYWKKNHSQISFSPILWQQQWISWTHGTVLSFKLYPGLSPSHIQSMGVLWKEENGLYIEFWTEGKAALLFRFILLQRVCKSLC